MALINGSNVGESTSKIAQAALSQETWLQPGVTCNDEYQETAAGKITIPIIPTEDLDVGTSRRISDSDFNYGMVDLLTNNVFVKGKDVMGYSKEALPTDVEMDAELFIMNTIRVSRQKTALAILATAGADTNTTATTAANVKANILATRKALRKKKAKPNTVLASVDVYDFLLQAAGKDFTPLYNDEVIKNGRVGMYMGMMVYEVEDLDGESEFKYVDASGVVQTVAMTGIEYIVYDSRFFAVVDVLSQTQKSAGTNFIGTRVIGEVDSGMKITNANAILVKKAL